MVMVKVVLYKTFLVLKWEGGLAVIASSEQILNGRESLSTQFQYTSCRIFHHLLFEIGTGKANNAVNLPTS